jgi:hypothetical protein
MADANGLLASRVLLLRRVCTVVAPRVLMRVTASRAGSVYAVVVARMPVAADDACCMKRVWGRVWMLRRLVSRPVHSLYQNDKYHAETVGDAATMQLGFDAYKLFSLHADPSVSDQMEEAFRCGHHATVPEWLAEARDTKVVRCGAVVSYGEAFDRMKRIAEFDQWLCHTYRHVCADQPENVELRHDDIAKSSAIRCKRQLQHSEVLKAAVSQSSEIDDALGSDTAMLTARVHQVTTSTPLFTEVVFQGHRRSLYAPDMVRADAPL